MANRSMAMNLIREFPNLRENIISIEKVSVIDKELETPVFFDNSTVTAILRKNDVLKEGVSKEISDQKEIASVLQKSLNELERKGIRPGVQYEGEDKKYIFCSF